jgi:hypothetical protein
MLERKIDKIILHCSDSDIPQHDDIKIIDIWHKSKGWNSVGYHYFIKYIGDLQIGRPLSQIGAHCYGENATSIGICLSGKKQFSDAQFDTLYKLCKNLMDVFNLKMDDIYGHNEFNEIKTCPNFNVKNFRICLNLNLIPKRVDMISEKDLSLS